MRKNRYVVGFVGREQDVVYGKETKDGRFDLTHSMTRLQAKKELKKLTGGKKAIFELIPCEVD